MLINDITTQPARRLNLTRGRNNSWRGRRAACDYSKPAVEAPVERDRVAVSCGVVDGIVARTPVLLWGQRCR
jgi:hypothetical protein